MKQSDLFFWATRVERLSCGKPHMYALQTYVFIIQQVTWLPLICLYLRQLCPQVSVDLTLMEKTLCLHFVINILQTFLAGHVPQQINK